MLYYFQVSTDDSDSYFSDPEDDYRNHINAPVMSPLDPVYPDADDISWKRAGILSAVIGSYNSYAKIYSTLSCT